MIERVVERPAAAFDHNRLLRRVATEVLAPLGLIQVGRSRTWVDDHLWWAVLVAFDASGFGRGTYLRVGVSLLWRPVGGLAFDTDVKHRWRTPASRSEVEWIEAGAPDAFERDLRAFTDSAVRHVRSIRDRPDGLGSLVARLSGSDTLWDRYHRAVAEGLTRDSEASERDFSAVLREPDPWAADWLSAVKASAERLRARLEAPAGFDEDVVDQIARCRSEARLRGIDRATLTAALRAVA
jgi:hypothetical protein